MKLLVVSFMLAVLTACDLPTEPPSPRLPRAPDQTGSIIIAGRVLNAADAVGVQAANVRVTEAGVSVGTDETGRYRIVLPARFRDQTVSVKFRAIGFNAVTRMVAITGNSVTVDLTISVSTLLSCTMGILDTAVGR